MVALCAVSYRVGVVLLPAPAKIPGVANGRRQCRRLICTQVRSKRHMGYSSAYWYPWSCSAHTTVRC